MPERNADVTALPSRVADVDGEVANLRATYLRLARERLPALAAEAGDWPIRLDHCFMRVVLDHVFGGPWHDHLDRRKGPAYRQMTADQLRAAIGIARRIEAGGRDVLIPLNRRSLIWRGKA